MKIHFDAEEVRNLLDHANGSPTHVIDEDGAPQRGLVLVGDHGVYLASCGRPGLKKDGSTGDLQPGESYKVAYAKEVDPGRMTFEEWHDAKAATFGHDDGVEYIDPPAVEFWLTRAKDGLVSLDIDETELAFG